MCSKNEQLAYNYPTTESGKAVATLTLAAMLPTRRWHTAQHSKCARYNYIHVALTATVK